MNYECSLQQVLDHAVERQPDKEVIFDGYKRVTYRELQQDVERLAAGLVQLGIQKGDRVMVCLPNWHEFVTIYFGIAQIGAVMVPCNTKYRSEEFAYIIQNVGAKAVFISDEEFHYSFFTPYVHNENHPLEHVFTVRFEKDDTYSYSKLIELGTDQAVPSAEINSAEDIFAILYTSGTTGQSKGAMLTHKNFVHTATVSVEQLLCTEEDVFLIAVPAFHVFGMVPGILSAIVCGGKIVFMDQYKAGDALQLIEQEKISVHHGVPTMFILELNHPSFATTDLSSLRTGIIAAAPCPEEIVRKIRYEMGCEVLVSYGLTETSAPICFTSFTDNDYIRSSTVGKKVPGYDIIIVDSNHEEVPVNEVGELACRGFGVMKGYYQMPEKTSEALDDDGWFYTGDIATIDENGYIRIVGRKKEMIIRGGYNIYPREIEEVFYKHESVLEVAIIGLPDTVLGEISCAAIKLKPGYQEDSQSMKAYIAEHVAQYKVPDHIVFLEEFPMTASGKIQKIRLQEFLKEQMQETLR